jgi:hypothetical protein
MVDSETENHGVGGSIPDAAIIRANGCFDAGAPYAAALGGAKVDLDEIGTVRNRIAHRVHER